jgi:cytochrome c peroxidase
MRPLSIPIACAILYSCSSPQKPATAARIPADPQGPAVTIAVPLGLPPLPIPADNPPTEKTIALGRKLYYETKLSADNKLACASCHGPATGFADPRRVSVGFAGKTGDRNSPTVINAAYSPLQFWDGRAATLEDQAAGPIANPVEMNMPHDQCVELLNGDAEYLKLFNEAFGPGGVTLLRAQKAIASFERTVLSGNSPFDRYEYGKDPKAMSPEAIRGLAIFKDPNRGNCAVCHVIGEKDALFTDGKFHNLGVGMDPNGELKDLGRYNETKVEADRGAFKTPTLRNVAKTAPYMHDGSQKTLKEVVDFYVGGGNSNPHRDKEIKELKLTGKERQDLVEFLKALTGEVPANTGPLGGQS